jgi:5-methylcytosine-specific restriction protein B
MARQMLANEYKGFGRSVQFHPGTTYETFVGGLAPVQDAGNGQDGLGFRFAPRPGFLLEAAAQAAGSTDPYLLHIDEINRADLSKILGEAIYLFESNPESLREIDLAYDFGHHFINVCTCPTISTHLAR